MSLEDELSYMKWLLFWKLGNAGNTMDGHNPSVTGHKSDSDSDAEEHESVSSGTSEMPVFQSTTNPLKPVTNDK